MWGLKLETEGFRTNGGFWDLLLSPQQCTLSPFPGTLILFPEKKPSFLTGYLKSVLLRELPCVSNGPQKHLKPKGNFSSQELTCSMKKASSEDSGRWFENCDSQTKRH